MWNTILKNLQDTGLALTLFVLAYGANTVLGLYYNIGQMGEVFDKRRFINGMKKALVIIIGLALLIVCMTTLPLYAEAVGWEIPAPEAITSFVIISAVLTVTVRYVVESVEKVHKILNYRPTPDNSGEAEREAE